jgi:hypothetical protein
VGPAASDLAEGWISRRETLWVEFLLFEQPTSLSNFLNKSITSTSVVSHAREATRLPAVGCSKDDVQKNHMVMGERIEAWFSRFRPL